MTPHTYRGLAAVWQEQVAPEEQSEVQMLARQLRTSARRRQGFDLVAGLVAIAAIVAAAFTFHPPRSIDALLAMLIAVVLWKLLQRYRAERASRALMTSQPDTFYAAAIANARAELRLSTFDLWAIIPLYCMPIFLLYLQGAEGGTIPGLLRELVTGHLPHGLFILAAMTGSYLYLTSLNRKLRAQLRQFERMRTECAEEDSLAEKRN
jgi:hypothetical protein